MQELIRQYLRQPCPRLLKKLHARHSSCYRIMIRRLPAGFIPGQNLAELRDEVLVRFINDRSIFSGKTPFELVVERNYAAEYFLYYSAESAGRKVLVRIGSLVSDYFAQCRNQYKHILHVLRTGFLVTHVMAGQKCYGLPEWQASHTPLSLSYDAMKRLALTLAVKTTKTDQVAALLNTVGHSLFASQIAEILKLAEGIPPQLVPIVQNRSRGDDEDHSIGVEEEFLRHETAMDPVRAEEIQAMVVSFAHGLDYIDSTILGERYLRASPQGALPAFEKISQTLKARGASITGEALRIRERKLTMRLFHSMSSLHTDERTVFLDALLEFIRLHPLS